MFEYSIWKLVLVVIFSCLFVWFLIQVFEAPTDKELWSETEDEN